MMWLSGLAPSHLTSHLSSVNSKTKKDRLMRSRFVFDVFQHGWEIGVGENQLWDRRVQVLGKVVYIISEACPSPRPYPPGWILDYGAWGGDDEDGTDIWGVWGCPGRDPTLPSHQRLIKVRAGQTATDGDWVVDLEEEIHTGGGGRPAGSHSARHRLLSIALDCDAQMLNGGLRSTSVMGAPPAWQGPAESAIFLHVRIAHLLSLLHCDTWENEQYVNTEISLPLQWQWNFSISIL